MDEITIDDSEWINYMKQLSLQEEEAQTKVLKLVDRKNFFNLSSKSRDNSPKLN